MVISDYDKAFVSKIAGVFPNVVFMTDKLIYRQSEKMHNKIVFPIIAVYRPDGYKLSEFGSHYRHFGGRIFESTTGKLFSMWALNVELPYSIQIISEKREDLDDITTELLLFFKESPLLSVTGKVSGEDDGNYTDSFSLHYVSGPRDDSYLEEDTDGILYKYVLEYNIPDALIFRAKPVDPDGEEIVPGALYTIRRAIITFIANTDIVAELDIVGVEPEVPDEPEPDEPENDETEPEDPVGPEIIDDGL